MMHMGDAQSLNDLEIHPVSSRSLISSSMKDLYFKGIVYSFFATDGPVVCRSISTRFVLQKSVGDLEMIHVKLFNIALSLLWINDGTFVSCSFIDGLLSLCV